MMTNNLIYLFSFKSFKISLNKSFTFAYFSTNWLAVEYIEPNKILIDAEKLFQNPIKNYDREGKSLPKMIVTFSSCNGFL